MRSRFEELMSDPCCASCDCDAQSSDVADYLDRKTCEAERCRDIEQHPVPKPKDRLSIRDRYESGVRNPDRAGL